QHALSGIRIAVCCLMTASIIKLFKGGVKDIGTFVVFVVALGLSLFTNLSTVILVIAAGLSGILLSRLTKKEAE
ncbi:MAG: chromate transporter, partial [Erysipelotrichaceae bacterium]|nr:chromate transporter [Erysipelotrichaceae bacterium]